MAKLDEDFSMLAQTEALQALSHPSKMNALKALLNKDIKRESLKEGSSGLSDNKLIEKVCKHHSYVSFKLAKFVDDVFQMCLIYNFFSLFFIFRNSYLVAC